MPTHTRSKDEFYKDASLSQQLAARFKEYEEYAGSDPQISETIAILNAFIKLKIISKKSKGVIILKTILNERRKAAFATSEHTNEITKMGLQMGRAEAIISDYDRE
jgi:hypothetical protein